MPRSAPPRFKDHFSAHAVDYRQFRPGYPDALFRYLAGLARSREMAWDCATGNGQAAGSLAGYFRRIIATDASAMQIAGAVPAERIEYRVASAEQSGLETDSVDLVTVAQALHWFDFDAFFKEVQRVLRPGGILAFWTYGDVAAGAGVDEVIRHFYRHVVGPYWPPERKWVESAYRGIATPFEELEAPEFSICTQWTLDELAGYIMTWSATRRYMEREGQDPLPELRKRLGAAWGREGSAAREISWPLTVRVCRKQD